MDVAGRDVVDEDPTLLAELRPEDDEEREYRRTVAWFIASAVVLLVGLLSALIDASLA